MNPEKITVLAEEAIPMAEVDAALLDERIRNSQEDILQAKTEADRAKAMESLAYLQEMRAAL